MLENSLRMYMDMKKAVLGDAFFHIWSYLHMERPDQISAKSGISLKYGVFNNKEEKKKRKKKFHSDGRGPDATKSLLGTNKKQKTATKSREIPKHDAFAEVEIDERGENEGIIGNSLICGPKWGIEKTFHKGIFVSVTYLPS